MIIKVNNQQVLLEDLVQAWLSKAEKFTSAPWETPESKLSPEDFARVSLIDLNEPGQQKVKSKIKFPIRSTPDGPVNTNALRNAASRLPQATGVPPDKMKAAAKRLVSLMRQANIEPGKPTLERAGMSKSDWETEVSIAKMDEERQLIYGLPLRVNDADSQGDNVTKEEIEIAAHLFMIDSQRYDNQHEMLIPRQDIAVVESYLAPTEFKLNNELVKEGDWVLVTKVFNNELWEAVKRGEFRGYSIKGRGTRKAIA